MKHFMMPRNAVLRDVGELQSPNPSSSKPKSQRKTRSAKENAPPPDLNSLPPDYKSSPAKMKCPLPPRPPSANPLKRKLSAEAASENGVSGGVSDSGVKVIVRVKPPSKGEEEEMIVKKISGDSLTLNEHTFTFDSIADPESTQDEIFQLVGAPLVENCLAGFNSSVFAYGQTGSGKTYTMWGPANGLLEEHFSGDQRGLTPRVFELLFARISEEQVKHADRQLSYQCRCSFLEIYNEQITDLLDPSQKNLMSTAQRRSTFGFSYKALEYKPSSVLSKADVGVQTYPEAVTISENSKEVLCSKCKCIAECDAHETSDLSNLQLVPVDNSEVSEKSIFQVPKAVEKVLAGSIRREMALEEFCTKQASEISQLNRLVQQYKHERECNAIIGQTREDKIVRLESLMDGVLSKDDFLDEEFASLMHEHKLLKDMYENHPEVLETRIELKRAQEEVESFKNFYGEMGERERFSA
ncbi:hypothetical protein F2Q68_00034805 [Brassica cretica]|uniref:Kinesin motor domain-containing protein n=1 Tax=Brassica cretica TaxID=69181 RepID=A0A8S9H3V3_BRACR|nr:hypothetical protein F2Q68_00034805 [Brassica cretica]